MRIIPAIDLINNKCVRLQKGDFQAQTTYGDPLETARTYADAGIQYLHLVDLDGAKTRSPKHLKLLESIATHTNLTIDFGGGISTANDVQDAINAGASQVNIGSLAVKDPEAVANWFSTFGGNALILSADVRNGFVSTHAWQERTSITLEELVEQFLPAGLSYVVCTDIDRDGMLSGPAVALYQTMVTQFPLHWIASGGVSGVKDLHALAKTGVDGVIIGKALYEGKIKLEKLADYA